MGIPVMVMGESGSGKSASLRNFDPEEVGIFNVASKPLPFRKQLKKIDLKDGNRYAKIYQGLREPKLKCYVIDDSQYLMAFESFARVKDTGYQKFTDIAVNFTNLVQFVIDSTPADCIVYFLNHTETTDSGRTKAKTTGKMIDNQITLEGLFSIVLLCMTDGKSHKFITQSDGYNTAKSPMEMFPLEIDNDLKLVDTTIREYYNI
ncbi:hypothetical protein [Dialister invisus]|uniref:hypothetical protein n=1 Tax=Dialister invisus TaxID=218538 RepID=UPI0023F6E48B|nr:hypothetical protein [Dialister invisus]